jgi:ABC-type glycerol-3-phosphate transport system permease component
MVRESGKEKIFNILNIFFMIVFTLVVIVPLLYIVANSFVSLEE